ncbi:hypothetical protein CLOP_g12095 [Closterium sp. NIES-67]|nr:hypothetical protein CLOP_g12095 [Closterium sp. NIES-67]
MPPTNLNSQYLQIFVALSLESSIGTLKWRNTTCVLSGQKSVLLVEASAETGAATAEGEDGVGLGVEAMLETEGEAREENEFEMLEWLLFMLGKRTLMESPREWGAWEHGSMGALTAWRARENGEHGSMGAWEQGSMGAWEH